MFASVSGVLIFGHVGARAGTITVHSGADGGGVCPGPTCTLRQAITTALPGDTIDFANGLATINLTSAELLVDKDLTISGPGAELLTVQRNTTDPKFRIFNIASGQVVISGLTITRGSLSGGSGSASWGGGILNQASGKLTVTNCRLLGNGTGDAQVGRGGAINNSGNLTISSSIVSGNSASGGASDGYGGGVHNSGTLNITDSTISDNTTGPLFSHGNGIYNASGAVTIANSTLRGNNNTFTRGGEGGAVNNNGVLTITDSTLSDNSVVGGLGGASGMGGAVFNTGQSTITRSTLNGNKSGNIGSAIFNSGTADLGNTTVTANAAPASAASIYNSKGIANLTNCTVSGNSAGGTVGGVYNSNGTVNARNTIIARNTIRDGCCTGPDFYGTLTSQGYNLIGISDGATITPMPGDQIGTAASPIDPILGPLQDNGGPTFTLALLSGSPARDKGNSSGSNTDQRGFTRPIDNPTIPNATGGDAGDIGAFEMQAALIARSLNLSTRSRVQSGDNVLIGGFIISGNLPKRVVLRGLGPSLVNGGVPVASVLNDPVLELRGASGALITSNDNWKDGPQRTQIEGTAYQPSDDHEAVIVTTLPPANYTAVASGKDGGIGVGVVEIYDLDQNSDSTLANISSRAFVETGNNVLIGGFILGGDNGSPQIVIRAIGPSLGNFGFAHPLLNPTLELRDANASLLAFDDDWRDDPAQAAYLMALRLQPQDDLESAIAATLPPGAYTAIVAGTGGGTGVALVEIYNLQ